MASGAPRPTASLTDATAQPPSAVVSVTPIRVLDTRPAPDGPIGRPTAAPLGPNQTIDLKLAGDGFAVPANATSVILNVAIDHDATLPSFLTMWPTGEPKPFTAVNNAMPGRVVSNAATVKLGADGSVSIFNQQGFVNLAIDLLGYTVATDDLGGTVGSGTAAPTADDGRDGGFWLDTATNTLYGPKTNGEWPTPGIQLGVQGLGGAASAHNDGAINVASPTAGTPVAIPFAEAGPAFGSVVRTDADTFTVSEDGIYEVSFRLPLGISLIGGDVKVYVNETPQGPTSSTVVSVATVMTDTVLVTAEAGDTIELRYTGDVLSLNLALGEASSIVVKQIG